MCSEQFTNLRVHYQALAEAHADFSLRLQEGVSSDEVEETREEISKLREIATTFQEALRGNSTAYFEGRFILTFEYEALKSFSANNEIELDTAFNRVKIENERVIHLDFANLDLSTLEGLGVLSQLRSLNLLGNLKLTSFSGINTQAIEKIDAAHCGLKELSALQGASKLNVLNVRSNRLLKTPLAQQQIAALKERGVTVVEV